jgi:hypothetical protein
MREARSRDRAFLLGGGGGKGEAGDVAGGYCF